MAQEKQLKEPIKYGDVFRVSEKLAKKPIGPIDAQNMHSAEDQVLGQAQRGGPAALMQLAAAKNVRAGFVPPETATDAETKEVMKVTEFIIGGRRVITESISDQVIACYTDPNPNPRPDKMVLPVNERDHDTVTKEEALKANAYMKLNGDKAAKTHDTPSVLAANPIWQLESHRRPLQPGKINEIDDESDDILPV